MHRPPNILLIVVDCLRSDKILRLDRRTRTPNLDILAAAGSALPTVIVEKACTTPAFASLLSGLYSPRHGVHLVWGYRLPERVALLTDAFRERGYATLAQVTGPLLPEMGLARGFDEYEYRAPVDYLHTAWGDRLVERLRGLAARAPWLLLLHLWELHPPRHVPAAFDRPEFGANAYERAISALDAQFARLFAAAGENTIIALTGDHGEKTTDETYGAGTAVDYARRVLRIDEADGLLPGQMAGLAGPSVLQAFYGKGVASLRSMRVCDGRAPAPPGGFWRRLVERVRLWRMAPRLTLGDLLTLGRPVRLTEMIRRRGLLNEEQSQAKVDRLARRLGPERLLHMHWRMWINSYKHNLDEGHMLHVYDFLVRVPLILAGPAVPVGLRYPRLVRQPDILPTLLELVGLPRPDSDIDGRSIVPLLRARPWQPEPAYVSVTGLPADLEIHGVRTERSKYSYGPHNDELPQELYDLQVDPKETRNLAAERPDVCQEMRALVERFRSAAAAPVDPFVIDAAQERAAERRLRELGYIE